MSAFKSTLQETVEASLLLHVIDAADARKIENIEAVNLVLEEIKANKVPYCWCITKSIYWKM